MNEQHGYQDLIVWKKSLDLTVEIYRATETFPSRELFGLVSQMRRASVSIPSNIAEGYRRKLPGDYLHFIRIAYGSTSELETQLILAKRLSFLSENVYKNISSTLDEISRMLNRLATVLSKRLHI
ncbi:MAG: four helix bundle protein [Patescibacteria group bacterium]